MGFMRDFLSLLLLGVVIFGAILAFKIMYIFVHMKTPWYHYVPKTWLDIAIAWIIPGIVVSAILFVIFVLTPNVIKREE